MNHNPTTDIFPLEAYSNNATSDGPQDLVVLGALEKEIQTEISEIERTRSSRRQRRRPAPVSTRRSQRPQSQNRQESPKRQRRDELAANGSNGVHSHDHKQMNWHWWLIGGLAALLIIRR